jgi:hypothetical protein
VCVFSQFYKHVVDLELAAAEKEFAAYTWEEEGSLGIGVKPMYALVNKGPCLPSLGYPLCNALGLSPDRGDASNQ